MIEADGILQNLMSYMVDSMASPSGSVVRPSMMDPQRSMEYNYFRSADAMQYRLMFGNNVFQIQNEAMRNAISGMYTRMGMSQASIDSALDPSSLSGTMHTLAGNLLMPDMRTGLNTIFNAAYRRRGDYWTYGQTDTGGLHLSGYAAEYRQLGKDILTAHLQDKAYGGLGFSDVSELTAEMISTGRYSPSGSGSDMSSKMSSLKSNLTEYARGMSALKDVIDGPVSEIVKRLEAFTGGNVLNMSPTRMMSIASGLRQAVSLNGVSLNDIGAMGGMSMSYMMNYGGTQTMAAQAAVGASYLVGSGVRVEGLSNVGAQAAYTKAVSNALIGGAARDVSASLMAYATANGLDPNATSTYRSFQAALGEGGYTRENLIRVAGTDEETWGQLRNSDMAVELAGTHNYGTALVMDTANRVRQNRDTALKGIAAANNLSLLDDNFFKSTTFMTRDEFTAAIRSKYSSSMSVAREADIQTLADARRRMGAFNGLTGIEAENIFANTENIQRNEKARMYSDALGYARSAKGAEGLVQYLSSAREIGDGNVADILLAASGVTKLDAPTAAQLEALKGKTLQESARILGLNADAVTGLTMTSDIEYRLMSDVYAGTGGSKEFTAKVMKAAGFEGREYSTLNSEEASKFARFAQEERNARKVKYMEGLARAKAGGEDAIKKYRIDNQDLLVDLLSGSNMEDASTLAMMGRLGTLTEYETAGKLRRDELSSQAAQAAKITSYSADISDADLKSMMSLSTRINATDTSSKKLIKKYLEDGALGEADLKALTSAGFTEKELAEAKTRLGGADNAIDALVKPSGVEQILSEILDLIYKYINGMAQQGLGMANPNTGGK